MIEGVGNNIDLHRFSLKTGYPILTSWQPPKTFIKNKRIIFLVYKDLGGKRKDGEGQKLHTSISTRFMSNSLCVYIWDWNHSTLTMVVSRGDSKKNRLFLLREKKKKISVMSSIKQWKTTSVRIDIVD